MRRLVISLAAVAVATAACSPSGSSGQNSSASRTLTVDIAADVTTLDPAVTVANTDWTVIYPCYEHLVAYKGATTNVVPDLAKSWSPSDGGKVWTFHLATGHKFSDGSPVNAAAVKFSFDRLLKINQGPAGDYAEIAKVEAPNPTTVRFVLKNAFAPFVSTLATDYADIVNPKVMDHQQNGDMGRAYLSDHTMGSGAYELKSYIKGQSLTLVPNPHWTGSKPSIQQAIFKVVADPSSELLQLQQGSADIAQGLSADQIQQLQGTSGVTVETKPSFLVDYMYMNVGKNGSPALKSQQVRQAISYAINYHGLIKTSQRGNAIQMRGPIPKGMWGYDPSLKQYTYDPAKAKSLLKAANVGQMAPLTLLYSNSPGPWWPTEALAIQANLKAVGIPVKLENVQEATMRDLLDKGKFDLAMGIWTPDYPDPYMFMNFWFDSSFGGLAGNRAFYSNPTVDHLIRTAATSGSQAQRTKLYQQAEKIVTDNPPYVYLYQTKVQVPMRSNVHGFVFNPMLVDIYNIAQMSKA